METRSLLMIPRIVLVCAVLVAGGCATSRADATYLQGAIAARAALTAQSMLGMPYKWGGHTPRGFDCSGLVYYSYGRAGATIPRTSRQLFNASTPVALKHARAGDLVFFRHAGKLSHVGIYLDDGRFIHAPSTGKRVQIASLHGGYYERNFIRAGRLAVAR